LLARFQLDYVLDVAEPSESIEALDNLPTCMEAAYVLLLERIEKRRRPTVIKVLSWLYRALRPLKQDEIREAIAVRVGAKNLSKPLLPLDSLIQYCQGLVTMDDTTEVVRFSHFTVKEFLSLKHYEDQLLSIVDCSRICLTYMNFEIFDMGPSDEQHYHERRKQYRLSEYVASYWGTYTKGQAEDDQQVVDALYTFFKSKQKRAAFGEIYLQDSTPKSSELKLKDLNAWTPLHTIAFEGLEIFYEKNVLRQAVGCEGLWEAELGDPHSKNHDKETPLLVASSRGHSSLARLLIQNGADVNALSSVLGVNSLHKAVLGGHVQIVKLLLEKDADINATDDYGRTPLRRATRKGNLEVVRLLLDKDAEINVKDNFGLTPLHLAAKYGHFEVVKLLEKDAEINVKDNFGQTPLHLAAKYGNFEVVKLLLEKDAEINVKDNFGQTPLHQATENGHFEVVKLLLEKDAEINIKDNEGLTPLHLAAHFGYFEVVKLLLEKDAEINVKDDDGMTPLHRAVRNGHVTVIALLCKALQIHADENLGGFNDLQNILILLTTIFPKDYVFWGALGNFFFYRQMYSEAASAYDMFAWNRNKSKVADIESMDLHLYCSSCGEEPILGYHYKCRKCRYTYLCRKCVQFKECIDQTPHDPFQIPSHWPLSPPELADSTTS
jgi:ankyrin repeat protein/predicted RNA-binding Zn-ribbon protein involved in translation (DUF1610 family)